MNEPKGFGDLIRNAQAGDPSARAALMDRFAPCVEQICRDASVRSEGDLSTTDVVQEAWLRIWQKFNQFHGTDDQHAEATLYNWLRQTARSVVFNLCAARGALRRNPLTPPIRIDAHWNDDSSVGRAGLSPAAGDDTPSEMAMASEESKKVEEAIESLVDETDRDLIRSRFYSGETLVQSAKRLNIPYDDARLRFHRALELLEKQLSELK